MVLPMSSTIDSCDSLEQTPLNDDRVKILSLLPPKAEPKTPYNLERGMLFDRGLLMNSLVTGSILLWGFH